METIKQTLIESKFVPVIRGNNEAEAVAMIESCIAGGINVIEMTFTNPDAKAVIRQYSQREDVIIGAGSVLNKDILAEALDAGSAFIVSPNWDKKVAKECKKAEVLYVPGCLTPTEVAAASNKGIDFVKIFPGDAVGMGYLKALHGPMPHMRFMVTGGVDNENYQDWFAAGASCVGLGSSLTKDPSKITDIAKELLASVK